MTELEKALLENRKMREALTIIHIWSPDTFPRVPDRFSSVPGATMSYGVAYGSNGERDFMRNIAQAALKPIEEAKT